MLNILIRKFSRSPLEKSSAFFASALKDAPTVQDARKKLNDMFTLSAKTNNSLNSAINDVIGTLSSGIGAEANEVLTAQGTQTGKMTSQGWRVGT